MCYLFLCITIPASLSPHHCFCIAVSASLLLHHYLRITASASLFLHRCFCIAVSASLFPHHCFCITISASLSPHHCFRIVAGDLPLSPVHDLQIAGAGLLSGNNAAHPVHTAAQSYSFSGSGYSTPKVSTVTVFMTCGVLGLS